LEREPGNRYPSANSFANDLKHLDQVGVAARTELTGWKTRRSMQSRQFVYYAVLALIPFALFLAMMLLAHHK
jgi:hypothetical protein